MQVALTAQAGRIRGWPLSLLTALRVIIGNYAAEPYSAVTLGRLYTDLVQLLAQYPQTPPLSVSSYTPPDGLPPNTTMYILSGHLDRVPFYLTVTV